MAATEEGVLGSLLLEGLKPERDGFLYIFAINETSNPIDFDNLIVDHKTGTLLAVNHYYPFGLRWNGQGSQFHKYQFGGKEYEEELNLNTYDFHARQMDPVLGRFWGVDPMSSERVSFSPFNYVQNNPMSRVDPTGMLDQGWFINADGFEEYSTTLNSLQRGQRDDEEIGMFDTDVMLTQTAGTPNPKKTPEEIAKAEKEKAEAARKLTDGMGKVNEAASVTYDGVYYLQKGIPVLKSLVSAKALEIGGKATFVLSVPLIYYNANDDIANGSSPLVSTYKAGWDIGAGAVGAFGGVGGFILSAGYIYIDNTIGWRNALGIDKVHPNWSKPDVYNLPVYK